MPLQATSGAASYDAFGGGVPVVPNYIESVFSCFLYTGNGSTQTITNGIDLSTKGGLVWLKNRSSTYSHRLFDTARGATKALASNITDAEFTQSGLTAFNTTGFDIGSAAPTNDSGLTFASWTFREQPKFFDVVTYTGNGVAGRQIAHSLGGAPGCMIVKSTSNAIAWQVYHRSTGATDFLVLNTTAATQPSISPWNNTAPTSSVFTVGDGGGVNLDGATYVAYLFAHDAGGFGLTGNDNVISCGSWSTTLVGGRYDAIIDLGWEPQWILFKASSTTGNWQIYDNMRGWTANPAGSNVSQRLYPSLSNAEDTDTNTQLQYDGIGKVRIAVGASGQSGIYIAIRRGPMKVPTSGTSVFYPNAIPNGNTLDSSNVPFPPDLVNTFSRNGTNRASVYNQFSFLDRLRGLGVPNNTFVAPGPSLTSSSTGAESSSPGAYVQLKADGQNISRDTGWLSALYGDFIYYFMRRAPSFFDVVCYTGTGSAMTVAHNLGVAPELMIVKDRTVASSWRVYSQATGNGNCLFLQGTQASTADSTVWNNTSPTSSVFTVGTGSAVNEPSDKFVAYLFATCAGVSKVGSYTGNGSSQTINCGFTGGARFVLIKKSSGTGDWMVSDSARGIIAGSDPYLELNNTNAEVTGEDWLDTDSTGFVVNEVSGSNANTSSATYIFLAIA